MKRIFYHQFSENYPSHALKNSLPSETIPDQAMTIPEIIARFTRTGMLPQSFLKEDEGNQEAGFDPEFDPLDHNPSEFDPKVHSDKIKALKAKSDVSDSVAGNEAVKEPELDTPDA